MAKDFAFKDVRSAINSIKKLAKELNIVSNYQDNKIKEIKKIFLSLDSSNYFSNISNNDLIGKDSYYKDDSYDKMLLSMYQYMISIDTIKHTKDLIKQIDDDTNRDIQDLIPGSNPVFWIFSSGKKKALTSEAYERLSKYNNSYIIEDANNVIKTVNDYETISVASASKDFQNNKSNYNNLIKSIIVSPDLRPKVEVLNDALSKYNNFLSKIEVVLNDARTVSDKIKKSIDRLIAEELLKILRNIPIEEINRDKKGIRIKPLRDAGYTNLANLYVANVYNLQAVYGVSQAQAYNISRIVSGYANEARKGIKIKLSFDDKNKYTNDVVKSLYIYKQKKIYLKNMESMVKL
mgnify:CR=1 FL=1